LVIPVYTAGLPIWVKCANSHLANNCLKTSEQASKWQGSNMLNYKKYLVFLKKISVQTPKAPFNSTSNKNSNFSPVSTSQPSLTLQSSQSPYAAKTANETNIIDLHLIENILQELLSDISVDQIKIKEAFLKTQLATIPLLLSIHE